MVAKAKSKPFTLKTWGNLFPKFLRVLANVTCEVRRPFSQVNVTAFCLFVVGCGSYACIQAFKHLAKSNLQYDIVLISSASLKADKIDRVSEMSEEAQDA